ncbi:MAG TPA: cytochrome P450 [Actinophytocola sp.]|uniref:cytochrome P450 n=1 Tax=Actinophytocola sp. TaxID=1872138 RepID=UPI002DDD6D3B|nr:cytochrome P450 [Actinophytocola sp.]HEV2778250.1 cytochrome P450 [Actinophytocola sp.]
MSWPELRLAVRPLPFLESTVDSATRVLELRRRPAPKLLVWHPEMVDWIFRSDQTMRHPGGRSLVPMFGARSPLWAEGSRHAAYRQVLGTPLRGRRLADQHDIIATTVHAAIDALRPGTEIGLMAWTRAITLRVIARIVLGRFDEDLLDAITAWIDKAFGARHRTLAYRYLLGGLPRPGAELDQELMRTAKAHTDLYPPTLAARMLSGDGPLGAIDDAELHDAVVSMIFAGHETTAAGAAWTLYWLDRNLPIQREVRAELEATGADGAEAGEVPLLQATVLEMLRLTPPAMSAEHRVLTEDSDLPGRTLPAGTMVTPAIYLAHHNAEVFPSPRRFDPHRFLGNRPPLQYYFPFGGGTRYCLGSQLAQTEIRMITAAVLRRRIWRCVSPNTDVPRLRGQVLAPAGARMRVLSCLD